jgi:hypothetical protein
LEDEPKRGAHRAHPQFYTEAVLDAAASREAGREIFREVEFCKVLITGDKDNNLVIRADEAFMQDKERGGYLTPKARWPEHYAAFKRNEAGAVVGTPLSRLPFLSKAQVAELQYHNITTGEQLADLGEDAAGKIFNGRDLRTQAGAWIDNADKSAALAKERMEKDALLARLAALEAAAAKPARKADAA